MILSYDLRKGCALCVAFLCLGLAAQAQEPYPRLDALACQKAIEQVEEPFYSRFHVQCIAIAADYCDAPISGPVLACLADLERALVAYVDAHAPVLPDEIMGGGFVAHSYARQIKALKSGAQPTKRCAQELALDRQTCRLVQASTRIFSLRSLAAKAGVLLP